MNELILLIVAQWDNVKTRAYLASVNFDRVEEGNTDIAKVVRVQSLEYDRADMLHCNQVKYVSTHELPFVPTHLSLDSLEANFCVYGKGGLLVGNLPLEKENS